MSDVEEFIAAHSDYCIVGNSPKELEKGRGKQIDSFDTVYRFNDFSLHPDFHKDYGKRVSAWIRGTNDKLVYTFEDKKSLMEGLDLIIVRAKSERNINSRQFFKRNGYHFDCYPLKYELELTDLLGFCPSTGLLTLFIFKKIHGKIDPSRVFGFSFCQENRNKKESGGQVHYYNRDDLVNPESGKIEKIKKTFLGSKHNWAKEESFFREFIMESK
jgi:hypothetical protein